MIFPKVTVSSTLQLAKGASSSMEPPCHSPHPIRSLHCHPGLPIRPCGSVFCPGRSACGPTHVARLEFPRETGLILRCAALRQTQRSPEGPRHLHRIPRLSEAPWEVP